MRGGWVGWSGCDLWKARFGIRISAFRAAFESYEPCTWYYILRYPGFGRSAIVGRCSQGVDGLVCIAADKLPSSPSDRWGTRGAAIL